MFDYRQLAKVMSKSKSGGLLYSKMNLNTRIAMIQKRRLDNLLVSHKKDSPLHYSMAISTIRGGAPYIFVDYHKSFTHKQMSILHTKELIDMTLGFDCHGKEFIRDAYQNSKGEWIMGGLSRHHNDRIKSINTPFLIPYLIPRKLRKFFEPNGLDSKGGWRVMLSPVYWYTHLPMHGKYRFGTSSYEEYTWENSLGQARETHLYEIVQRAYDPSKPDVDYYSELILEFKTKQVNINGYNVYIWDDSKITDSVLLKIIDRWIERKTTPSRQVTSTYKLEDDPWYNDPQTGYYKNFFDHMYKDCENYVVKYMQMDVNDPRIIAMNMRSKHFSFYQFYVTGYLGTDTYPLYYPPKSQGP